MFCPLRKKLEKRNTNISRSQAKLAAGRITVRDFLEELAFPTNNAVTGMEEASGGGLLEETIDELQVNDDLEEYLTTPNTSAVEEDHRYLELHNQIEALQQELEDEKKITERMICVICKTNERTVYMLPCKHLSVCNPCCDELQKNKPRRLTKLFRCPVCRAPVAEIQKPFF